ASRRGQTAMCGSGVRQIIKLAVSTFPAGRLRSSRHPALPETWLSAPTGTSGSPRTAGTSADSRFAGESSGFPRLPHPGDLAKGPDGNMWFTEPNANAIGRITPNGQITEYPAPASPSGIVAGPDDNVWFTEPAAGKVARFILP